MRDYVVIAERPPGIMMAGGHQQRPGIRREPNRANDFAAQRMERGLSIRCMDASCGSVQKVIAIFLIYAVVCSATARPMPVSLRTIRSARLMLLSRTSAGSASGKTG